MKRINAFLLILVIVLSLSASCSQKQPAPDNMKALETEMDLDYNIYIPYSWVQDLSTGIVSAYVSAGDFSNISMVAFALKEAGVTNESFWEEYSEDFQNTFSDFKYEEGSPENMLLGGTAAVKHIYGAEVTGQEYKFMQIVCVRNMSVYIFTYTAHNQLFDGHLDEVKMIVDNFSFK